MYYYNIMLEKIKGIVFLLKKIKIIKKQNKNVIDNQNI